jgi:hypothetical protein
MGAKKHTASHKSVEIIISVKRKGDFIASVAAGVSGKAPVGGLLLGAVIMMVDTTRVGLTFVVHPVLVRGPVDRRTT